MDEKMRDCGFHSNTVDSVLSHPDIGIVLDKIFSRPNSIVKNLRCKLEAGWISLNIFFLSLLIAVQTD